MADNYFKVSDIYQGGYSTFDSEYGSLFTGYRVAAGSLGLPTDPRTADIISAVAARIPSGAKVVDVTLISNELFESVPQQHLKEVKRLAKLTGVDLTVHGPLIEPSGITKEGYTEAGRQTAERQMALAVERSHELDAKGNINVTFHSSAVLPAPEVYKIKEPGMKEKEEITESMLVINQETGQIRGVKRETKHYPIPEEISGRTSEGKKIMQKTGYDISKGIPFTAEAEVKAINDTEWDNDISQVVFYKERADRLIDENYPLLQEIMPKLLSSKNPEQLLTPTSAEAYNKILNAQRYLDHIRLNLNATFNKAYKFGTPEEKKALKDMADKIGQITQTTRDPKMQSMAYQQMINRLSEFDAPEVHKPLNEFAMDKAAETFGKVAFNAYDKFGNNAPIVSIENPPAGTAFARGEDLKKIVEKARETFVEKAVNEGMSKGEAKKAAEKLIGVTWDVGHINMLRKYGFEKKDIVKESEKIKPYLKHIHLSDNFGFEHTELPMGMGNVPFKEIMKKLGKEGFEAKKLIEAGNWWQHFKTSPFATSLEAMGSPIYSIKTPYWNQALGLRQSYFAGYGETLPQVHFQTFGAGFSGLPMELGGQITGGSSRVTGRPME